MDLNALKRAVEMTKAKREIFRTTSLAHLREAVRTAGRTIQDDKQIFRLQKQLDSEIDAHKAALEELAAMKAQLNDDLSKIKADITLIAKDVKERKKRRGHASRINCEPRGKAGDEIDWDEYEVCRAIDNQLTKAHKEKRRLTQLQAAERVIESYNEENDRIQCTPETLCTYYRRLKKRRKKNRTD